MAKKTKAIEIAADKIDEQCQVEALKFAKTLADNPAPDQIKIIEMAFRMGALIAMHHIKMALTDQI